MNISIRSIRAFSLIELVIVVVIIAIIGAIAIPKMSRGAAGANDAALLQDLSVMRKAIEHYAQEHNGSYPPVDSFRKQLTKFTDEFGNVSNPGGPPFIYGPYLTSVPELPVGAGGGQVAAADGPGVGWIYDETTGNLSANTTATDARGVPYSSY